MNGDELANGFTPIRISRNCIVSIIGHMTYCVSPTQISTNWIFTPIISVAIAPDLKLHLRHTKPCNF